MKFIQTLQFELLLLSYIHFLWEERFYRIYKNLAGYIFENNFIGPYYSIRNVYYDISLILRMQYFSRIGILSSLAVLYILMI